MARISAGCSFLRRSSRSACPRPATRRRTSPSACRCRRWATVPGCSTRPSSTRSGSASWPAGCRTRGRSRSCRTAACSSRSGTAGCASCATAELDPNPIAGVPEVRTDGNGGLMDVAVHPGFADNGLVYLTYTKGHADGRGSPALARGRLAGHALHDVEDLVVTAPFHTNSGLNGRVAFGRRRQGLHVHRRPHPIARRRAARRPAGPGQPARQGAAPRRRRVGARRQPVRRHAGPSAGDLHDRTPQHPRARAATPGPGTSGSTRTAPTAATS